MLEAPWSETAGGKKISSKSAEEKLKKPTQQQKEHHYDSSEEPVTNWVKGELLIWSERTLCLVSNWMPVLSREKHQSQISISVQQWDLLQRLWPQFPTTNRSNLQVWCSIPRHQLRGVSRCSQRWQGWQIHACISVCCAVFLCFFFFLNPAPDPFLKHNNQAIAVYTVTFTTCISTFPFLPQNLCC